MIIKPIATANFAQRIFEEVNTRIANIETGEQVLVDFSGFAQTAGSLGTPGVCLDFYYRPRSYDAKEEMYMDYAHQVRVYLCNPTEFPATYWMVTELRTEREFLQKTWFELSTEAPSAVITKTVEALVDLIHEYFFNADLYVDRVSREMLPEAPMKLSLLAAKISEAARKKS